MIRAPHSAPTTAASRTRVDRERPPVGTETALAERPAIATSFAACPLEDEPFAAAGVFVPDGAALLVPPVPVPVAVELPP